VAARVGINSATLHYYFPDKEVLIGAVVAHLLHELRTPRVPPAAAASALDRLRAEFADIRARLRDAPEQLVVLTELAVRAGRDPAIARLVAGLNAGWRGHLGELLQAGVTDGAFRADLDVDATAQGMMTQLWGLVIRGGFGGPALDPLVAQLAAQTEHWVRTPPRPR
jgi:AcrR family transcriptional regulator